MSRSQTRTRQFCAAALCLAACALRAEDPVTDLAVRTRIHELTQSLVAKQSPDGSWGHSGYPVVVTALAVLSSAPGGMVGGQRTSASPGAAAPATSSAADPWSTMSRGAPGLLRPAFGAPPDPRPGARRPLAGSGGDNQRRGHADHRARAEGGWLPGSASACLASDGGENTGRCRLG